MIRFIHPEWFFLFLVWGVAFTAFGWWRTMSKLRVVLILLGTLLLTSPQWQKESSALEVKVLVDRSDSTAETLGKRVGEWEALLRQGMRPDDQLSFYDFADEVAPREANWSSSGMGYQGKTHRSKIVSAIRFALAQTEKDRQTKVLLFTDGQSTESYESLPKLLSGAKAPLFARFSAAVDLDDYRVVNMSLPTRVLPKQVFVGAVEIRGPKNGSAKVSLWRDQTLIQENEVTLPSGQAHWKFSDVALQGGAVGYTVKVKGDKDPILANNQVTSWVEVEGGQTVLLLSGYSPDPLAQALIASGFNVKQIQNASKLQAGDLSQVKVVIFNNYPAHQVSNEFLKALPFYVQDQGGGLIMFGGDRSFGSGGYHDSPIDPILPISMEMKQDVKRLATAMVYVLDRSGSMSVAVGGRTKMDLANDGTARSLELLGESDFASIIAVDSSPHVVAPMMSVQKNLGRLTNASRRVKSMGGGIFVHEGLTAAYKQLKDVKVGQRHVILFSDANDSEEPGDYKKLLKQWADEKITLSVIGLGKETDVDGALLKELGELGGGRVFFTENASDLPAIFSQETVSVARSTFFKEPVGLTESPALASLMQRLGTLPPQVDGYNLNYPKTEASIGAHAVDEENSPLLAYWSTGVGRSIAVSFPVAGSYSDAIRLSKEYQGFVSSLTQWAMGTGLPPGVTLRTQIQGDQVEVELYFEDAWREQLLKNAPKAFLMNDASSQKKEVVWERLASNAYRMSVSLDAQTPVRGAIQIGDQAIGFGPITYHVNPEWDFKPERKTELLHLIHASGGKELIDLQEIWQREEQLGWEPLLPWLLGMWLVLMLIDAYFTKIGKHRTANFWLSPLLKGAK